MKMALGASGAKELKPSYYSYSYVKIARLSALHTGRLYPPGDTPGIHFFQRLSRHQGHSAAGRIMSTKIPDDSIRNQTHDLLACSAVTNLAQPIYIYNAKSE